MTRRIAVTRPVSASLAQCELTHVEREPIDVARARLQHASYVEVLRVLGCEVIELPAADDLPDAVFVEDTAIVLDEIAVIARPGAASRRPELESVIPALAELRPLHRIEAPATLDGGDVLRVGRTIFVGQGSRTEAAAVDQLRAVAGAHGYDVVPVPVHGCLHLKTAITAVSDDTLLMNRDWIDVSPFERHRLIEVAPHEPFAGNVLRIGDQVMISSAFPRTAERLIDAGVSVVQVDMSELARAEGGLTCCSIVFED